MTTPVAGVALDSESVKLLRAGDVLRIRDHLCDGGELRTVERVTDDGRIVEAEDRHEDYFPECYAFVSRHDVPALTDEEGAFDRLTSGAQFERPGNNIVVLVDDLRTVLAQASAYKERGEALEAVLLKMADAYEGQGSLCGTFSEVQEADAEMDNAYVEARALLNGADR